MHYKDGTPVALGDLVIGNGYNVKHPVQGVVVGFNASDTCNITVARVQHAGTNFSGVCFAAAGTVGVPKEGGAQDYKNVVTAVRIDLEYGEARNFEKVA